MCSKFQGDCKSISQALSVPHEIPRLYVSPQESPKDHTQKRSLPFDEVYVKDARVCGRMPS